MGIPHMGKEETFFFLKIVYIDMGWFFLYDYFFIRIENLKTSLYI